MKRRILFFLLLLIGIASQAQTISGEQLIYNRTIGINFDNLASRGRMFLPKDTLATLDSAAVGFIGGKLFISYQGKYLFYGLSKIDDSTYAFGTDTFTIVSGTGGGANYAGRQGIYRDADTLTLGVPLGNPSTEANITVPRVIKFGLTGLLALMAPDLPNLITQLTPSLVGVSGDHAGGIPAQLRVEDVDMTQMLLKANGTQGGQIEVNGTSRARFGTDGKTYLGDSVIVEPNITDQSDTTAYKPVVVSSDGRRYKLNRWPSGNSGSDFTYQSDFYTLPEIELFLPAIGISSSTNVTNYTASSVDSAKAKFSTTRTGGSGTEYGGWLAASTSGDSIRVTAPFGVILGDSHAEGHPLKHGRLHWLNAGVPQNSFKWDYPDSSGQVSYHLAQLTNMRWYNHGIGGQTSTQILARFYRDALGFSNPGATDGRGNRTLSRKPAVVVLVIGINDIFNGIDPEVTKANVERMAGICQENKTPLVVCNIPGDGTSGQSELKKIAALNLWFASGALNQYGATVVDFNELWNRGSGYNDNFHPGPLVVDQVHFGAAGNDSLARKIFRDAKLPVLQKAVFINELSPGGFTGYSRPSGITINSSPYSISSANDTISISTFVPDSVWVKVTSSTNITGTSYSGFSHIEWMLNNSSNDSVLTKRPVSVGSQKATINAGQVSLLAPTLAPYTSFKITLADMTTVSTLVNTSATGSQWVMTGAGTNPAFINNSTLSVYPWAGGTAIGSTGNIKATGTAHQFGQAEILQNGVPSTTGFGWSVNNTNSSNAFYTTPSASKDAFVFSYYFNGLQNLNATPKSLIRLTQMGFGNATGFNQYGYVLNFEPEYNQTTTDNPGLGVRFLRYAPKKTSLTNTSHTALFLLSGNNYLNITGDSTLIGYDSTTKPKAKFQVNGAVAIDGMSTGTSSDSVVVINNGMLKNVSQSSIGANFFNTNLTSTGNRSHSLGSNYARLGFTGGPAGDGYIGFNDPGRRGITISGYTEDDPISGIFFVDPSVPSLVPSITNSFGTLYINSADGNSGFSTDGTIFTQSGGLNRSINISSQSILISDEIDGIGMSYFDNFRSAGISNMGDRWIPDHGSVKQSIADSLNAFRSLLGTISSGDYTPTLTGILNVDAVSLVAAHYMRVGDQVTVDIALNIDPTAISTNTNIDITLPVASTMTNFTNLSGIITSAAGGTGNTVAVGNKARTGFESLTTSSAVYNIHFMYRIQ